MQQQYGPLKGTTRPEAVELGNLGEIRTFAQRWKRSNEPIDVLCLNAGAQFVGQKEPKRTQDGFELTVGVNHLGHFLLEQLLQDSVEKSKKQPRIVVTTSEVRSGSRLAAVTAMRPSQQLAAEQHSASCERILSQFAICISVAVWSISPGRAIVGAHYRSQVIAHLQGQFAGA